VTADTYTGLAVYAWFMTVIGITAMVLWK